MKKNNLFKRILAIGIAVTLAVPFGMMWTEGNSVATASDNLVTNGDFENNGALDATGWTPGVPTIKTEEVNYIENSDFSATELNWTNAGSYGSVGLDNGEMKLTNWCDAKYSKRIAVTQGQTLAITYNLRGIDSENVRVQPRIIERDASGNGIGNPYTKEPAYRKPTSAGGTATATHTVQASNAATIEVHILMLNASGTAWIDDFKVTSVETVTAEVNHIKNSDFSAETLNWTTGVLDNGEMKLTGQYADAKYDTLIAATKGQVFTMSYNLRGIDTENIRVCPRIIERDASGNGIGNPYTKEPAYRKPTAAGGIATATHTVAADNAAYIEVHILITNANGTAWIDNFKLTSVEPVYGDGIVVNGSDYEMRLSNTSEATYTGATLTADTYYDYSYEVAKDATLTKAGLKIGDEIKAELTGTFKYASGQSIGFATEGSGFAHFDNLVIKSHSHVGGTATCIKLAECTGCGQEYGTTANHDWNTTYERDSTGHWNSCKTTGCLEKGYFAAHGDTDNNDLCDACSYNVHQHSFSTQWSSDGSNHWKQCTVNNCQEKQDLGTHSGGTATCTEKAKCTVCTAEYGNVLPHDMDTEWSKDETNHWHACKRNGCTYTEGTAAHDGGTSTCTKKAECTVCTAEYGSVLAHTYDKEVVKDETLKSEATTTAKAVYYKSCECGAVSTSATFEYGSVKVDTNTDNQKPQNSTTQNTTTQNTTIQNTTSQNTNKTTSTSPKTGDSTSFVWFAIAVVSVGVISIVLNKKYRME